MAKLTVEPFAYPAVAAVLARSGSAAQLARSLAKHTGLAITDGPFCFSNEQWTVLGNGPGRWLVFAKEHRSRWPDILSEQLTDLACVFDQSSAFAMWRLSGPAAETLLQKGLFIDLHPGRFRVGSCCAGLAAQVAVSAVRTQDETWEVAVARSYGDHFQHWLEIASANVGISLVTQGRRES